MAAVEKDLAESKSLLIEANERIHYQQQAHIKILENRILIEENLKEEIKQLREELKTERNFRQERKKNAESYRENVENDRDDNENDREENRNDREDDENDREESFNPFSFIRENLMSWLSPSQQLHWDQGNLVEL